jgi:transposase
MNLEDLKSRNNLSLDEIDFLIKHEMDVKILVKLYYFRFKAMGFSSVESYKLAKIPKSTAYYIEDLWNDGGYNALLHKRGQGRESKLNKLQMEELKEILGTKDKWAIVEVGNLIKEKWNVEYSYFGVRKLLINVNVKIENLHDKKSKERNMLKNQIEGFEDLSKEEKKELQDIVNLIKKEKKVDVLKRLIFLLLRKIGLSNSNSSHFLGVTTATGNNWLRKWNENQYSGLLHKPGQGRKSGLTLEHINNIKKTPKKR